MTNPKVRDPVCGMAFDADRAAATREYRGTTYHFCSDHCSAEFGNDPDRYAGPPTERRSPPRVR